MSAWSTVFLTVTKCPLRPAFAHIHDCMGGLAARSTIIAASETQPPCHHACTHLQKPLFHSTPGLVGVHLDLGGQGCNDVS